MSVTNEEKAKEIANEMVELAHYSSVMTPDEQRNNIMNVADVACMEMAKWKDAQFKEFLFGVTLQSNAVIIARMIQDKIKELEK